MESEPTTPDAHSTMSAYHESNIQFLRVSAREWLEAVLEENLDRETSLEDLLADGTLLYRVAQHLKDDHKYPGHVESPSVASPSFDRKSSLKYQPYASVEDFLKVCKEVGLRDVDVFNPSDAVDQKDIRRVCVCLRRLSKKARTLHLAVPDFDNVKETLVTKMPRETVQKTKETLQQSASRSSSSRLSNENGQTPVSSETSSSIADLRKDDDPEPEPVLQVVESDAPDYESESPQPEPVNVESDTFDFRDTESEAMAETFNKVHHDVAADHKEPVVTDSKYTVKVAEPGVDTLPLASDHVDRNFSSKSTDGDSKVISEAPPAPKVVSEAPKVVSEAPPAVKPTMSRIMLKPPGEVKAPPVEQLARAGSEESQKGLFKAHLQGTAPYIKKEVEKKEVKKEKPKKDDNLPWLLAGAVAIAGGILGLTLWKKRDSDQSPMAGLIGSGKKKLMKLRNHIDHSSDSDSSSDSESDDDEAPKRKFFGGVYEVKDGDNLTNIAKRTGKKHWREIADKNPSIGNPDLIYPGDRLKL